METNPMVSATLPGFIRPGEPSQISTQMPFRALVVRPAADALANREAVVILTGRDAEKYRAARLRPVTVTTNDILNAYDAFDGEDVGTFTGAWDDYLAGRDTPCPERADGLHQVTEGSCDMCGSKNR